MNPVEWYYARENKQMGPVSALELKRLATVGELRPGDLVWREGMTEWSLAQNVRGLFDGEGRTGVPEAGGEAAAKSPDSGLKIGEPARPAPSVAAAAQTPGRHLFDALLGKFRPHFGPHFIEATARVFRACGSYGLLAAMGLTAVFAIIMAAKTTQLNHLLTGAIGVLLLAALQYAAGKFCDALGQLEGAAGGFRISSTALPDCLVVLSMVAGVALLLQSVALAIATSIYPILLFGVMMFLILGYLAAIALNPTMLGISIAPAVRGSDEAIGVLTFLMKALLRLVPVAFGAGVICAAMLLAYACGQAFSGKEGPTLAADTAAVARLGFWWFASLPLVAYVLFLLACLALDLFRAILILPGKLDKPAATNKEQAKGQGGETAP